MALAGAPWPGRGPGSVPARLRERSALRSLGVMALAFGLAACGTISRSGGVAAVLAQPAFAAAEPRVRADDLGRVQALAGEVSEGLIARDRPQILALSGGGADGAYGAGVIVGWTDTGRRPDFAVVTGVSTGALVAPFAFLGPGWDDELQAAYAGARAKGLLRWRALRTLFAASLFSPAGLRDLVSDNVTPDLLEAVAAEHAKGRRLLVVTTNLDSEETVIWDMGVIASKRDRDALELFRKVLLASASIPGVFPPVLFAGASADGRAVEEMHVDGGVNAPFLAAPESLLLSPVTTAAPKGGAIYVLVNGKLEREERVTGGSLRAILARSYGSASKASLRSHLASNAAFATRNGMALYVSAIPQGAESSSLDFAPQAMRRLFEAGRSRAAAGEAWQVLAPGPESQPAGR